jgi:hypothetical protein
VTQEACILTFTLFAFSSLGLIHSFPGAKAKLVQEQQHNEENNNEGHGCGGTGFVIMDKANDEGKADNDNDKADDEGEADDDNNKADDEGEADDDDDEADNKGK